MQCLLAWYINLQRKSSETSSISKKLVHIIESLHKKRRRIKIKNLLAFKCIYRLLAELLRFIDSAISLFKAT